MVLADLVECIKFKTHLTKQNVPLSIAQNVKRSNQMEIAKIVLNTLDQKRMVKYAVQTIVDKMKS